MKMKLKYNRIFKLAFILSSIIFISSATFSISTLTDYSIIEIENVSHTQNTAVVEFEQFLSYYVSSENNVFVILLYGDSDDMDGAVIIEISTEIIESRSSLHTPISETYNWFELDSSLIELSGNVIFVDFQNYNILHGAPQVVRMLALSSTESLDEFSLNFKLTLELFSDLFKDSNNGNPSQSSSESSTSLSETVNSAESKSSDSNNISTTNGFDLIIIFVSLSGVLLIRKRKNF